MATASNSKNSIYRESFSKELLKKEPETSDWLQGVRRKAYDRFEKLGFPTREEEAWKYINLEPILGASFVSEKGTAPFFQRSENRKKGAVPFSQIEKYFLSENQQRLVFVDGVYSKKLSSIKNLPSCVILQDLATGLLSHGDLIKRYLGRDASSEKNAFSSINTFSFKDGLFLYIPDKVVVDSPINIILLGTGSDAAPTLFYSRILVAIGECSRVRIIVNYAGLPEARYFNNTVAEVHVGEGACLDYFQIERGSKNAYQVATNHFYLGKFSTLETLAFTEGGAITRNEDVVEFQGEKGFASLKGLSLLNQESEVYNHVVVNHKTPDCTSRQLYKNILSGKARSEFNSLVRVWRGAQKSDSNQLNRTLLLSDTAENHSRPQLKIDADDVSCTHGATVGQLEKDELFYLRSRGLSKELARFVLTSGFAEEVIQDLEPASLREHLRVWIAEELETAIEGKVQHVD